MKTAHKQNTSIILVEDDHALSRVWKSLFEMLGYRIDVYQSGSELLERQESIAGCDILVTDYYLPDLNGVELVKEVRQRFPALPVIVLTGSHEAFIKDAVARLSHCQILYKPLNVADIQVEFERMLD